MDIPNELIKKILFNLTPRHKAQCSLVCKNWYQLTREPIFYKTIILYSFNQLYKFIQFATTVKIKGKPIGHWVQEIKIAYPFYTFNDMHITYKELKLLHTTCPYIIYLDLNHFPMYTMHFPYFKYLFQDNKTFHITNSSNSNSNNNSMMDDNDNDDNNIVDFSTSINIKDNRHWLDYIYDHAASLNLLISTENQHIGNDPMIRIQRDIHLRYHKGLMGVPLVTVDYLLPIMELTPFYGKVISFTRNLNHLKELYLHINLFNSEENHHLELDERTFDAIHSSCPSLESLNLMNFYFNHSTNNYNDEGIIMIMDDDDNKNDMMILPCTSLKAFKYQGSGSTILHYKCFYYLMKKYPQLELLDLELTWDILFELQKDRYIQALLDMITSYKCLKHFYFDDSRFRNSVHQNFTSNFPLESLISWFCSIDHPPLESLGLYNDLSCEVTKYNKKEKINKAMNQDNGNNNYNNNDDDINSRRKYLDYLKKIKLTLPLYSENILHYLLREDHYTIASSTITNLDLKGVYWDDFFYIYEWLDAFPNLTHFTLTDVCITERKKDHHESIRSINHHYLPFSSQQQNNYHHHHYYYQNLQYLYLRKVNIKLKDHVNELCQAFPSLKVLSLDVIGCLDYDKPIQNEPSLIFDDMMKELNTILSSSPLIDEFTIIDAPHLKLDQLFINNIQYGKFHDHLPDSKTFPLKLTVHENGSHQIFHIEKNVFTPYINSMKVNCHSVDVLVFENDADDI